MIRFGTGCRQACCRRFVASLALMLVAGTASTAAAQQTRPQRVQASKRALLEANPGVRLHERAGRLTGVYGRAFSFGQTPVDAAEAFRVAHAEMFGVSPTDLQPGSLLADQRRTQPVMYDRRTGTHKFTLVYYTQYANGIPVFRADIRLLARNVPESPVVLASSGLRDLGGFSVDANSLNNLAQPAFVGNRFTVAKQSVIAAVSGLVNFSVPRVVVWAGVNDMKVTPRVALTFIGDNFAPNAASDEKWLFVTDVATGAILHREFVIYRIDGNASGKATEGVGADRCEAEVATGLPHLLITSGANSTFADVNGDFTITADGGTVDATLSGRWFDTINASGPELSESESASTPADLFFNIANANEFERAQVNGYIGANVVHDFVVSHNPAYPTFTDTNIPVVVNRADIGICPGNAFYDPFDSSSPTGYSINFCSAADDTSFFPFPNMAFGSVIYHEFGHHLVQAAGSGQGQYGEGLGDVMSVLILDDSRIGVGFFDDGCGASSVLRNANNTLQYPCSDAINGIHFCGQVLSGCIWNTRNQLAATNPATYLDILGNLAINSILLHAGDLVTPQITTDFLTLDDDDGDLSNGTPHSVEILAGFGAHNMIPPPVPANNDCANAIPISEGATPFNTTSATTDGQAHLADCGDAGGDGGQTYQDIWYSYVAPCSGLLTVTTCEQLGGSAGYDSDLVIYEYDGVSCGSRAWLACNDDDPINSCGGFPSFHSTIQVVVVQGDAYLIRVGGWNEGHQGPGTLFLANDGFPCCPAPTAVCKQGLTRTLSNGEASIAALEVDDVSIAGAGCTVTNLEIKKTANGNFGPAVTFGCGELGLQDVTLRVIQLHGEAQCMATVMIQETDVDGDGVGDCSDGCPDDPSKVDPGACGCGTPEADTDGDGVPDCIDNCPDTPNSDQVDSDRDGLGDACRCDKLGTVKVNIGDDLVMNVGERRTLGGGPAAVGGVPPYQYQWMIQGVDTVETFTSIHPVFTAVQPGTFTANLVVSDSSGCTSSASLNIVVNGSGPAGFFTDGLCADGVCGMGGVVMPLTLVGIGWLRRRQRALPRA